MSVHSGMNSHICVVLDVIKAAVTSVHSGMNSHICVVLDVRDLPLSPVRSMRAAPSLGYLNSFPGWLDVKPIIFFLEEPNCLIPQGPGSSECLSLSVNALRLGWAAFLPPRLRGVFSPSLASRVGAVKTCPPPFLPTGLGD